MDINTTTVLNMLQAGEGSEIEFKSTAPAAHRLAKSICAMSNRKGGYLLIGANDFGKPVGIEQVQHERLIAETAANEYCTPPQVLQFKTVQVHGQTMLVILISEATHKPVYHISNTGQQTVYIRSGASNVPAAKQVIQQLYSTASIASPTVALHQLSQREQSVVLFLRHHHSKITVKRCQQLVNFSERRAKQLLQGLQEKQWIIPHDTEKELFYTLA